MFTSYFGRLKSLPAGLVPVSIAIGPPRWFKGRQELRLAPTRRMLKMPRDVYDRNYDDILSRLDPVALYQELVQTFGPDAVLLCWEMPNVWCHRRRVAEWFEAANGIEIEEYGYPRDLIRPYRELPEKEEKPRSPAQKDLW
jgi:hypothetical protein